jgi:hypothetical protein
VATPTFRTRIRKDGVAFEIYAYRSLTNAEIDREIALFIISHHRFKPGMTYKIFSRIGQSDGTSSSS